MFTLGRLANLVLFVFSLSLLVCAAPTPTMHGPKSGKVHMQAVRGHHEGAGNVKILLGAIIDLKAKVVARADAIGKFIYLDGVILGTEILLLVDIKADALVEAQAEINKLVADIELCSNTIASLKSLNLDAKLKASIATHVLVVIKAILKICASLTIKFGIQLFLELFANLDLCLKVLLRSLDVCMDGFLVVLGKLLVEADIKALVEAKLIVCHDLFVLVRAAVGIVA
ncbi:transmembrane protein, putative [Rhizoctonia solani AG-3 Rhs1AP]|uniref:Transmembrane protein, putative n=1 Tax=Rhizoctonia solani AG-3 Rhs1AP TaxID=1086054 RepID=A0A0A1ULY2_9AGAM|nr:transmembrane protein, putative [Rhizoctonia solani AG-3 Rhs1AP]